MDLVTRLRISSFGDSNEAAVEIERLRHALAKCRDHANDGLGGSATYALDRLTQIVKVITTILEK